MAGQPGRGLTQQQLATQSAQPQLSCASPSWASIVRDGTCARRLPHLPATPTTGSITKEDFVALYEQCKHAGLKARVALRHAAGRHEVSLTCYFSSSSTPIISPAARRHCCRQRHHDPAAIATESEHGNQSCRRPPELRTRNRPSVLWPPPPLSPREAISRHRLPERPRH
jgi:hypothetical protein